MRFIFFFTMLIHTTATFACSDLMKNYEYECLVQDQFKFIEKAYAQQNLSPLVIKGFNLQKLYGQDFYQKHKDELLTKPFGTFEKNKEWRFWHNGQRYLEALNSYYLNLSDLLKLHQALNLDRFFYELNADSSILRTLAPVARPKQKISCEDRLLDSQAVNLLFDFDLLSDEALPLLELKLAVQCPDPKFFSGEVVFYKGASINFEMNMWLNDFNDMIMRYEHAVAPKALSPYDYLADMKRRFMSLRPFNRDNEELVNALIEYAIIRLELPPLFLVDEKYSYLQTAKAYRKVFRQKASDVVSFFHACMAISPDNKLSRECDVVDPQ